MEHGLRVGISMRESNAELIQRCQSGQADAWSELVNRYERLVYAIPIREGLGVDDAAEVAQHTFATLVKELNNIREPARLSSWLMTVARREVWRKRRASADALEELIDPATAEASEPQEFDDWTDRHVELAWLYDAIQSLGEPCRSLVFGLFFDPAEPSYAAVAVNIGRPIGSIGPLRSRCLDRLRVILEEGFSEES